MKKTMTGLGLLLISTAPALAGGIERAPQSLAVLFEQGNYVELSFGGVDPTIEGRDIAGYPTGDVAQGYGFYGLSYKHQFNENLSGAFIMEQPFGSDLLYPQAAEGGSPVLNGTRVEINSTTYTAILRYKFDNNFSVHGGLRASHADGRVTLDGLGYASTAGYNLDIDGAWGMGWVAGAAYEIPDYAARVSLTYNSPIDHDFDMSESGGLVPALSGQSTVKGNYTVRTPRSWVLEGQTGIAEDTLLFGSIRWVKWSEFKVDNFLFPMTSANVPTLPPGTVIPLVELDDTTTYTLGVGRKFNDQWAGSIAYIYEPSAGGKISPLAPYDGRKGIQVAAIYSMDDIKITTGVNYSKLGDADLGVGPSGAKRDVGQTTDNELWGIGVRVGYSF